METQHLLIYKVTERAVCPTSGTIQAAGFDLYAAENMTVLPLNRALISTDIIVQLPEGCYGRIAPRSGLALNHFLDVGAGVIDPDYRGIVKVLLFNFNTDSYTVNIGDRIAQIVCEKICKPKIREVSNITELDPTARDTDGFGSTS